MKTTHWQSLVIPLDSLVNSANWSPVCRAVEDRIVSAITGTSYRDYIDLYAQTEGTPAEEGQDEALHHSELVNEIRTLFNYNESLPQYIHAMDVLTVYQGQDFQISESNDRAIVVLIEGPQ